MKQKANSYASGIVNFLKEVKAEHDFTKSSSAKNYDQIVSLRFNIEGIRDEDKQFIEERGHTLSLKIRCPYFNYDFSGCRADVTDYAQTNQEYSVIWCSPSEDYQEMFIYLEKAGLGNA